MLAQHEIPFFNFPIRHIGLFSITQYEMLLKEWSQISSVRYIKFYLNTAKEEVCPSPIHWLFTGWLVQSEDCTDGEHLLWRTSWVRLQSGGNNSSQCFSPIYLPLITSHTCGWVMLLYCMSVCLSLCLCVCVYVSVWASVWTVDMETKFLI